MSRKRTPPEGADQVPLEEIDVVPLLQDDGRRDGSSLVRALLALGALAGGAALGLLLLLGAPLREAILPELVAESLEASGVSNPVTAVLLNFRSYDTLLEVVVLLVAMVAIWSMDRGSRLLAREEDTLADPVLEALARFTMPLAVLAAVYLAWAGSHRSGGAFQAGALLAGAGVLLAAAGFLRPPTAAWHPVRVGAAIGVYLFVGAGLAVIPWGGTFMAWPEGWAYGLILAVEAVLTISIAVVLVELFVDVPSVPDPDPALEGVDPTGDPLGRLVVPGSEAE